jgi:NADPH:quinone reductase-like Zn-dependent oxidoreductase
VFDPVGGPNIGPCIHATRLGGTVVGYGFMGVSGATAAQAMFANLLVGARLRMRRDVCHGITMLYRKDPKPLREDLPKIFALVAEKQLETLVGVTLPLVEAKEAMEMLAGDRWKERLS